MELEHRLAPRRRRGGFTLVEVLIATALLGFSLIVMFGFHAQAARSNQQARKITACTYLAQTQLEQLLALSWTETNRPTELSSPLGDTTTSADPYSDLPHPGTIAEVNAADSTDATLGEPVYRVSWAVEEMDGEPTWLRVRIRCAFYDKRFATYRGTTISSYRYRDD
jgi:prepilin-type N-terminal cleavage/methylation domain-containing protein